MGSIWGHTHHDVDTTIGETRLLSRQRGYAGAITFMPAVVEMTAPKPKDKSDVVFC